MNWKDKFAWVLLFLLCFPGAVFPDMQGLLQWFGTGTDDPIVEFIPSTFSDDGGSNLGPPFRWTIGTFAGGQLGMSGKLQRHGVYSRMERSRWQ